MITLRPHHELLAAARAHAATRLVNLGLANTELPMGTGTRILEGDESQLHQCWTFVFQQDATPDGEPSNYPSQPSPTDRIEAVHAQLEPRGRRQVPSDGQHAE